MKLFYSPPDEISTTGCWCLMHRSWLYTGDTLWQLLRNAIKYWKSDITLIG